MEAPARERPVFEDTTNTPGWIREWVYSDFPITFEPDTEANFLPLIHAWRGFSFAHPPHDEAQLWCEKAAEEAKKGHWSVLLLPAIVNSIYWRTVVLPNALEIRIIACPIKKPGKNKQIVSQMALVIFADRTQPPTEMPPVFIMEPPEWETKYYKRPRNLARFKVKK